MKFSEAVELFERTLSTERDRPDVHAAMRDLAVPDTIAVVSEQIQQALARGERVWMTADLHIDHANIIAFCNRPFGNVQQMNEHLVSQTLKVENDELSAPIADASGRVITPACALRLLSMRLQVW